MARALNEMVVVVTGASSGLGRATARAFARHGAMLVLAARGADGLAEVGRDCRRSGGRALAVVTDVAEAKAVDALARQALATFGRIDVWINNAGVGLFSRLEETPWEAVRRALAIDLLGTLLGCRAALPIFREQGAGVLVNVSSVAALLGRPQAGVTAVAAAGIRVLGQCLRMDLADAPGIHVCTVLPAEIDTPYWRHGANYTGRVAGPLLPALPPELVAAAIVGLSRRPRREAFIGAAASAVRLAGGLAPGLTERMLARRCERAQGDAPGAAATTGSLFRSHAPALRGGWVRDGDTGWGVVGWLAAAAALTALPLGYLAWKGARP